MGLFSSSKKTYVNTSISRLVEDKDIPDLNKVAVADYLFDQSKIGVNMKGRSIGSYYNDQLTNSTYPTIEKARRYAAKEDAYAYGLRKSDLYSKGEVRLDMVMDEYLERTLGHTVVINYALFGGAKYMHFGWQLLKDYLSYDSADNTITRQGNKHKLINFRIAYSKYTTDEITDAELQYQNGVSSQYGETSTRERNLKAEHIDPLFNVDSDEDYLEVNVEGLDKPIKLYYTDYIPSSAPISHEMGDDAPITPESPEMINSELLERDYIMVQYLDHENNLQIFTYHYGSNEIPELEKLYTAASRTGQYYPNLYLRLGSRNLTSDALKETDEYKSSRKLGKKLGIDFAALGKQLHEEVDGIHDVVQCFVGCQLSLDAEPDELIDRYMFEFFMNMYNQMPKAIGKGEYDSTNAEYINGAARTGNTLVIRDKAYTCRIAVSSLYYEDAVESIGEVGKVTKHYRKEAVYNRYGPFRLKFDQHIYYLKKQVTPTVVRTIHIVGLTVTQEVRGGNNTVTSTGENLSIPLEKGILSLFTPKERNLLATKSLVIVFNSLKVVKKKWYQKGIFKVVIAVIGIAITIFTGGAAGAGVIAVLTSIATSVVVGLAISLVIKLAVKVFNIELTGILAVVAIAAVVIAGGIGITGAGEIMGMTAKQFMMASNYALRASMMSNEIAINNMLKEHREYGELMADKMADLEAKLEELETNPYVNPEYLLANGTENMPIYLGETADDLITRTMSFVSAGMFFAEMIPNMVEVTVRLPSEAEILTSIYQKQTERI